MCCVALLREHLCQASVPGSHPAGLCRAGCPSAVGRLEARSGGWGRDTKQLLVLVAPGEKCGRRRPEEGGTCGPAGGSVQVSPELQGKGSLWRCRSVLLVNFKTLPFVSRRKTGWIKSLGCAGVLLRWLFQKFKCKLHAFPRLFKHTQSSTSCLYHVPLCVSAEHRVQERHAVPWERPARCAGVPALAARQSPRRSEQRGEVRWRAAPQGEESAVRQRGAAAIALRTIFLFKINLPIGSLTPVCKRNKSLG